MTSPTMLDLYANVSKLLADAWMLPRRHLQSMSPALLELSQEAQLAFYEGAEDILTRGLMKQGLPHEVARHSAFEYVRKTIDALEAVERRARGLPDLASTAKTA